MHQVLQSLASGRTRSIEIPAPTVAPGMLLIRNHASVMSTGTERMLVEFGRANLIQKARSQPEKMSQVVRKARTDGLVATIEAVRSKLEEPMPLGYSSAGEVVAIGGGVAGFRVGDRVASNGPHAGVVLVPKHLCAVIPSASGRRSEAVSYDEAAFTVLGAIALQGVRLAQPTLGEVVAVIGLGLIGLFAAQILHAQGCTVVGLDLDPARLELARAMGVHTVDLSAGEDPIRAVNAHGRGRGVDAAIIAAATSSNEPVRQAAAMCRKRGRIVLVGVTGLDLVREDFYQKEISFQVSCSYGPGRYDPSYEQDGNDYPIGFVRWTEQRNFEAVLDMIASGRLDVHSLITHRFPVQRAEAAYAVVAEGKPHMGIVLTYDDASSDLLARMPTRRRECAASPGARVALIGAGQFATRFLAPALKAAGAKLVAVVSQRGASAVHVAEEQGFAAAATDVRTVIDDPTVDAVVIATRHDTHAALAAQALAAGKHVFLEKPVAIHEDELRSLATLVNASDRMLHVGFNRRWSPHAKRLKEWMSRTAEPAYLSILVNAGAIPADHWTQRRAIGGGRVIGEVCHFVDLARFLADSPIESWMATPLGGRSTTPCDTLTITLSHENGTLSTISYLANGSRAYPKERVEVFQAGRTAVLDNFRQLVPYGWEGARRFWTWRQDKGHRANIQAFVDRLNEGGQPLIPWAELEEVTRLTLDISNRL